jgi:hypothetical protein
MEAFSFHPDLLSEKMMEWYGKRSRYPSDLPGMRVDRPEMRPCQKLIEIDEVCSISPPHKYWMTLTRSGRQILASRSWHNGVNASSRIGIPSVPWGRGNWRSILAQKVVRFTNETDNVSRFANCRTPVLMSNSGVRPRSAIPSYPDNHNAYRQAKPTIKLFQNPIAYRLSIPFFRQSLPFTSFL